MDRSREPVPDVEEYNQKESQFVVSILMALNGGGAIALLTFLGQVWSSNPELRGITVLSISVMTGGLTLITLSALLRLRSMDWGLKERKKSGLGRIFARHEVYIPLRTASFVLFLGAVGELVVALWIKVL